jgi:hypothetical protein
MTDRLMFTVESTAMIKFRFSSVKDKLTADNRIFRSRESVNCSRISFTLEFAIKVPHLVSRAAFVKTVN